MPQTPFTYKLEHSEVDPSEVLDSRSSPVNPQISVGVRNSARDLRHDLIEMFASCTEPIQGFPVLALQSTEDRILHGSDCKVPQPGRV